MPPFLRSLLLVLALFSALLASPSLSAQSTLIPLTTRRGMVFDKAGQHLYISTSYGTVESYNLSTHQFDNSFPVGSSFTGIDIAPDDSFLIVTENNAGGSDNLYYRINLPDGKVTKISIGRWTSEGEAWDVAIASNGLAFVTSQSRVLDWVPVRTINLATNFISQRPDAPGTGFNGTVWPNTRIARSADRTRLYFLEGSTNVGPVFTYNATTNKFDTATQMYAANESVGAAVNRDGTILGTCTNNFPYLGSTNTSLDSAPNYGLLHGFSGMNAGVAFDAVRDIFYSIGNGGTQVIAFDTNTFSELFRINISETVSGPVTAFDTGTLVASQDGRYLALETLSGIRLLDVNNNVQGPAPTFTDPKDMVFDHSGKYLYIATYDGHVWPYNLVTRQLETPYTFGGSLLGLDIASDDSFLIAAQGIVGITQGTFQKLDLRTGTITNLYYMRDYFEAGGWGVALTSNGTALGTTEGPGFGWVPLHDINLTTGTVDSRIFDSGFAGGKITNHSQLHRSADRTRLCILESDLVQGPLLIYDPTTDTFGPSIPTGLTTLDTSIALSRTGSLFASHFSGELESSLYTAPNFELVNQFCQLDGGVAFDAVQDRFYGVNSSTDQIIGYDTNDFTQKIVLTIGEDMNPGALEFGPGNLVASQDGRYLALQTSTTVRVYAIPPNSGPTLQIATFTRVSNGHVILQAFATPNSTNSVQESSSLAGSFTTIGTVIADGNGFIQFEDINAGGAGSRFYKVTSP